jgi:hypothetical protein
MAGNLARFVVGSVLKKGLNSQAGLADMFHLWSLAEQDLLSERIPYRLRDTGQGLNRVQAAPKTSRMMHAILNKAQRSVGTWIGSSAIHMGDHNVPNALMFIGMVIRLLSQSP